MTGTQLKVKQYCTRSSSSSILLLLTPRYKVIRLFFVAYNWAKCPWQAFLATQVKHLSGPLLYCRLLALPKNIRLSSKDLPSCLV